MLYSNVWVLEISIENLFFFKLDPNTGAVKTMYTFSAFLTPFLSNFCFAWYQQAGRGWGILYVSGALRRTYTLFYPHRPNTSGKKLQRQKNVWDLFLFLHYDVLKSLFVLETCFENL